MAKRKVARSTVRKQRVERMPMVTRPDHNYVSPSLIAHELEVTPQEVFGLVTRRRVRTAKSEKGKYLVHQEDVREYFAASKAGLLRNVKAVAGGLIVSMEPPFKPGVMITYHPRLTGRKPVIALVLSTNRVYTLLEKNTIVSNNNLRRPTERMSKEEYRNETLQKLIKERQVAILNPWEVVVMCAKQFEISGQPERAASLMEWVKTESAKRKEEQANVAPAKAS